jgi:hypothetical protein
MRSMTLEAPTTFEQAVEMEIAKGCHPKLAAQRAVNKFGRSLPHKFAKRADHAARRVSRATNDILDTDCGSRVEALRKCRLENPAAFDALQRSAF